MFAKEPTRVAESDSSTWLGAFNGGVEVRGRRVWGGAGRLPVTDESVLQGGSVSLSQFPHSSF